MKTPTVFFGASSYVLPVIAYLHENYDLQLIITTEKEDGAVPTYCQNHQISYVSVTTLKDQTLIDKLVSLHSSFAVLADFGLLVPQSVIDLFSKGIINIHPSLLPLYRGPTPGMTALLRGDTTTGISIMLLDKDLDHGPLLGQVTTEIYPHETSGTLYPRLFQEGTALLKKVLPEYLAESIKPVEQDHSKATFTEPHLTRESGYVSDQELATMNHELLDRKVRAYFPWPTVWTRMSLEGRLKGKIMKLLPEGKVQVEGKKPQSYKDFLNGYPEAKEWLEKIIKR